MVNIESVFTNNVFANKVFVIVLFVLTVWPKPLTAESEQQMSLAQQILAFIDSGKTAEKPFELRLTVSNSGTGKAISYKMKDDGKTNTILEFLDKRQRGQKVLSTKDDIWFFAKRTRRAIKIPPIQRLYGDASVGDISRLRFAVDYQAVGLSDHQEGLQLELLSNSRASTYQRILLWVDHKQHLPVKAHLFAASGKHIKTLEFIQTDLVDGVPILRSWEIFDPSRADKRTRVETFDFKYISASPIEFTKSYLELKG